jgi:large subunit ribosomal protein L22
MPVRSDRPVPVRQGGSELPGKAIGKYVRVPPRKAREVVELIKGLPVEDAEQVVRFSKRRGAKMVGKVLKAAVSSARQSRESETHPLRVAQAVVDEGPMLKRVMPRARGVRNVIRKRTSHIKIVVEER